MRKVAILGGTFDPIHKGHLELAKTALKMCGLDEVWFIPTFKTPLKDREITSFEVRVKMIKAAIAPYRKMKVCLVERYLPSPSYSINTVDKLKKENPNYDFYWIIGDDQYVQLDKWHQSDRFRKEVKIICFHRNNQLDQKADDILFVEDFCVPVSSTEVREGNLGLTVKSVRNIIFNEHLYTEEICRSMMGDHRYKHSVSVANVCITLAAKHGVNCNKAFLAGIYHDIFKEMDSQECEKIMRSSFVQYIDEPKAIWHQWLAVYWLKHHCYFYDHDVLKAIENHVQGNGKGKLSKILYLADKIDPSRGYDSTELMKLSCIDLDKAVSLVKLQQQEYLNKEKKHAV